MEEILKIWLQFYGSIFILFLPIITIYAIYRVWEFFNETRLEMHMGNGYTDYKTVKCWNGKTVEEHRRPWATELYAELWKNTPYYDGKYNPIEPAEKQNPAQSFYEVIESGEVAPGRNWCL